MRQKSENQSCDAKCEWREECESEKEKEIEIDRNRDSRLSPELSNKQRW